MQPTYKCLIDKTVKELPSLEALADRYPCYKVWHKG